MCYNGAIIKGGYMPRKWKGGKNAAQARYRKKNKDKLNKEKREFYHKNKQGIQAQQSEYRKKNKERIYAYNAKWQREQRAKFREAAVTGYGHKCICCGVSETVFLEIHHPEGNGKVDRKEKGGSLYFYRWLVENNFPQGYELVCANCHKAIHQSKDGICPHKQNQ